MTTKDVLNLKTPDDLWHYMHENIKYGWTNKKGEFREYGDPRMLKEYYYHLPEETIERRSGLCGDQVLLEKMWFDYKKIKNHVVSFGFKNDEGKKVGGGHTFLVYVENNRYYYFENAFAPCANISDFDSFNELVGTAIAAYLLTTNNTDKMDKLYVNIDGHLNANNNHQQDYKETINDEDFYDNYRDEIEKGVKKFRY